jgi:type VI secretion system secreted protein VgrG
MRLRSWLAHGTLSDSLDVFRVRVDEGLSTLFVIDVEFVCDDPDLDLEAMVWTELLVGVDDLDGGPALRFHGVIEEADYLGAQASRHVYRLRAWPRVHGLLCRQRSRIFQNMSVVDVVKTVVRDAGIPDDRFVWNLAVNYPRREYVVQYKESELAFILRLLEQEGIFFWFEHGEGQHVMMLADENGAHPPIDGDSTVPSAGPTHGEAVGLECVRDLVLETNVCPDEVSARDWNWRKPGQPREAVAQEAVGAALQQYEFPGGFDENDLGGRLCTRRLHAATAERYVLTGRSNCRRLHAGRKFDVVNALPDYLARDYTLVSVRHEVEHDLTHSAASTYGAMFVAIPGDQDYRPPRRTPKPRIFGKEIAVVTGPAGEEIHVDDYGRIKIHFYWDREGKNDDTSSCWVRVQQMNTSGSMILPRVGWEVEVGFLGGDPDRPLVMQRLYNRLTMPPYALPANKTQSALQTSTSPGGGSTNEIRLQDSDGAMEAFIHASKDFSLVAGNNVSEHVDVDALEEVGLELKSLVGASESVSVGGKQSISVAGSCAQETVGGKSVTVGGSDDWGVSGKYGIICGASRTDTIGGLMNVLANHVSETFNATCSRTVGGAFATNSATSIVDAVAGAKTELVGGAKLEIVTKGKAETIGGAKTLIAGFVKEKAGTDVSVSAKGAVAFNVGGPLVIKCGADFTLGARAIVITAPGGANMKAGGSKVDLLGGKITVNAASLGASGGPKLELKGSINYKP